MIVLSAYAVASAVFVFENLSDFSLALRAGMFIVSASQANGMFFCYGINVNEIQIVHTKLQEIVDEISERKQC